MILPTWRGADVGGRGTSIVAVLDTELLTGVDLFGDLAPDELDRIAAAGAVRAVQRGDVLFSEGDEPTDLYVVSAGRIAIANRSIDGRESVMALMEPGDLFGEMPLFDGHARSAEARALEPSEVAVIPYEPLRALYAERPQLLWKVVELLAMRLRATDAALADSVFLDVTGRTAKRLLELSSGADEFSLPVTQEELAGMVGASRERVNKAIASFIKLGWLSPDDDGGYTITDRDQLTIRAT